MAFNVNEFSGALTSGGREVHCSKCKSRTRLMVSLMYRFLCKRRSDSSYSRCGRSFPFVPSKLLVTEHLQNGPPTIINDEDFAIRNAMEQWSTLLILFRATRTTGGSAPALYKADAQVIQYSQTGDVLREYNFVGIFRQRLTIDLAWETEGIQEYTVTFQYDYWEVSGGTTGNALHLTSVFSYGRGVINSYRRPLFYIEDMKWQ